MYKQTDKACISLYELIIKIFSLFFCIYIFSNSVYYYAHANINIILLIMGLEFYIEDFHGIYKNSIYNS